MTERPVVLGLVIGYAAADPARLAGFWAAMLGREPVVTGAGVLLPAHAGQVGLRFGPDDLEGAGPECLHLHLTSTDPGHQREQVARAVALGGRHLDVGQPSGELPGEGHVVAADPEGNALCVIEAGNRFLAGCGPLGEVACDGLRDVGLFWSAALGWPLVWDQDGETAIQSPVGGTKVAWGGPPVAERRWPARPDRQWFEVVVAASEVAVMEDRLLGLGATRISGREGVLVDVGGHELRIRSADPPAGAHRLGVPV